MLIQMSSLELVYPLTFRLLISLAKKISRREIHLSIASFISDVPAGSRVLNIGSGGTIMQAIQKNLKHSDIVVQSTDIDPDRKPDIVDDLTDTKLAPESFDFIVCSEVLEHVTKPHIAAENLFNILKPGGRCLVTTPYIFPTHDAPHDYFRYTEFGLRYLFSKFEIVDFKAKTRWWETLLLLAWRTMWLGGLKTKIVVWFASIFIIPLLPIFYLFSRKKTDLALTAGFIVVLAKPA